MTRPAPQEIDDAGTRPAPEREYAEGDGDLTDTLGQLRVLLPSAQLLSAFLITVPRSPTFIPPMNGKMASINTP